MSKTPTLGEWKNEPKWDADNGEEAINSSEAKCGTCKHTWASHGYRSCTGNRNLCQCKADVPNSTWDGTKWVTSGQVQSDYTVPDDKSIKTRENYTVGDAKCPTCGGINSNFCSACGGTAKATSEEAAYTAYELQANNTTFDTAMRDFELVLEEAVGLNPRDFQKEATALGNVYKAHRRDIVKELEWLQSHASGGGSWRRVIEQRIEELK